VAHDDDAPVADRAGLDRDAGTPGDAAAVDGSSGEGAPSQRAIGFRG